MRTALEFLNVAMRVSPRLRRYSRISILPVWIIAVLSGCGQTSVDRVTEAHRITATIPESRDVILSQQYVCQIQSPGQIEIRALERGYLEAIEIKTGQPVKKGDRLFTITTILDPAMSDAESAEARLTLLEYNYLKKLWDDKIIVGGDMLLIAARAERAKEKLGISIVQAPFDGIVDHLIDQQGRLVQPRDVLTTLSDNSLLSVYFKVPEKQSLEYMANKEQKHEDLKIELILENGSKFDQPGKIAAIEADFNNNAGVIPVRADFENPDRLLRHEQTGTVVISRVLNSAIVIPQRATFEVLEKRYVFTIDNEDVAHRQEIVVENELEDLYVIKSGVNVNDKIVLEGIRQVRDGQKLQYEIRPRQRVEANLKYHPE